MASVTPQSKLRTRRAGGTGHLDGYVTTVFDPPAGQLQIDGLSSDGQTRQAQGVTILIICPSAGSQHVNR